MLSIVQVNCLKLYTTYTLSVEVDCYVLIFVILDNNYWHFFLMLYIWKTSYCSIFSQFRALSDQLYRSPDHHASVREQITQQVGCN